MKNRLFSGILFGVLGLLIAIGPQTVFHVCPVGDIPMKCHWTARAEIGLGVLIAISGILLLLFSKAQVRMGLSISLFFQGVLAFLVPNVLIGVCGGIHMDCHKLTQPVLTILSALIIIASAINGIYLYQIDKRRNDSNVR
ncbi:MAG: hypothetical protein BGN88_00100 [Clostridiales bacterium 43-6]|nr:MAG: hypothetical protein BGN88_00100 [Clostridiales bacterium 43-6]